MSSLWRKSSNGGAFAAVSGDGVEVNLLDTVVVDHAKINSLFTTNKKGFIARKDPALVNNQSIFKSFVPDFQQLNGGYGSVGSPGGSDYENNSLLESLPVVILHKENNIQELVDYQGFANMLTKGQSLPLDIIAIQRFIPPRGCNLLEDEHLLSRGKDTSIANYFHEFNLGDLETTLVRSFRLV